MKKSKVIIWSVILVIIAVIATLLILSFNGIIGAGDFSEKSYSTSATEIENIEIDVRDREIEILTSEDDQIHINYYESEKEKINVTVSNGQLNVKFVDEKSWIDRIGLKPSIDVRRIKIQIPNNLISNLEISTTNENITLSDLSIQNNLTLNSNGGDIKISSIQAGSTISLTTKNGSISGSIVGSWDEYLIDCTIKKGETNLPTQKTDGTKHLICNCNNGDINISFVTE